MSFLKDLKKDLKKDLAVTESQQTETMTGGGTEEMDNSQDMERTAGTTERSTAGEQGGDVTVIAAGTVMHGNVESEGSMAIYGTVLGDVVCGKKLIVAGEVKGQINAKEIFINKANIYGDVVSEGGLKMGSGSVVMGNIFANSAVVAGAVKGEVDIKGPVIIDNTAVIKGNIKSKSVQINNGAVIDGYCQQCYNETSVSDIFNSTFPEEPVAETMMQESSVMDMASVTEPAAEDEIPMVEDILAMTEDVTGDATE